MDAPSRCSRDDFTEVCAKTLWRFLRGEREAILEIAPAKGMLNIGVLFVLSATLAREYDGVDLLAEPWHLLLPLAASLITSFLLFSLLFGVGEARGIGSVPFGPTYLRFLGLYWMTAPLAWLYAIPVESFLPPPQAMLANLGLLGVVSAWRVWLMTRVVQALFNAGTAAAWSVVMLFADAVALVAIAVMPKPVIAIMGGISHTDAEIAILNATLLVGFACVVSLPVWLLSTGAVAVLGKKWEFAVVDSARTGRPARGLQWFAAGSVAAWLVVLPITQPQQRLARRVDSDLRAGKISEALGVMAAHNRSDFPARWDPPPHVGYGEKTPAILDVMEAVLETDAPAWVRSIFIVKFGNTLYDRTFLWPGHVLDEEFNRHVNILLKLPEGPSFAAREEQWIRIAYDRAEDSEARRSGLKSLLDLAETYDPQQHPSEQFARPF